MKSCSACGAGASDTALKCPKCLNWLVAMEPAGAPAPAAAASAPAPAPRPLPTHLTEPAPPPIVAVSTLDGDLLPRREAPAPAAPPREMRDGDFLPATSYGPPSRTPREMPTRAFIAGGIAIVVLAAGAFFFFLRDANSSSPKPASKAKAPKLSPIKARLADRTAESQLRNALTAEKVIFTDLQAYTSTIASLKQVEPSVRWGSQVRVVVAKKTTVCLSQKSASGTTFAVADVAAAGPSAGTYYGPKPCPVPLTAASAAKLGHNFGG
jgi:hypothetical protein